MKKSEIIALLATVKNLDINVTENTILCTVHDSEYFTPNIEEMTNTDKLDEITDIFDENNVKHEFIEYGYLKYYFDGFSVEFEFDCADE